MKLQTICDFSQDITPHINKPSFKRRKVFQSIQQGYGQFQHVINLHFDKHVKNVGQSLQVDVLMWTQDYSLSTCIHGEQT